MRLTVAGLKDAARALRHGEPYYIPAAGEPGELAVMTTPDSLPGMRALVPEDTTVGEPRRGADRAARRSLPPGR